MLRILAQTENIKKTALWFRTMSSSPFGPFGIDGVAKGIESQKFSANVLGDLEITVNLRWLDNFKASSLLYDTANNSITEHCMNLIGNSFLDRFGEAPVIKKTGEDTISFVFNRMMTKKVAVEFDKALKDNSFREHVTSSAKLEIDGSIHGEVVIDYLGASRN